MVSSEDLERRTGADANAVDDGELERYGVWVKTAPEDVADEESQADAMDLVDDVDDEASQLTIEEEELLAPLESESQQENGPESAADDFADFNLDDIEDISLDDLDDESDELGSSSPVLSQDESDELDFDVDALDLDLDDLEVEDAAAAESPVSDDEEEITLDLDDLDLADLEGPSPDAEETAGPPEAADESEITDFDLDDISLPLEPEEESSELDIDDDESGENLPELELEEEDLELELIEDEDSDSAGFDDLHAVDDLAAVESELSGEPDTEEFDVDDFETEDSGPSEEIDDQPQAQTASGAAEESSILAKIEGELSAIKRELTDLRQELSVLRSRNAKLEGTTPAEPTPAEAPAVETDEEAAGFFEEEDEDETIALTGAELDNILNTAEFTEEDGEPTEIDEPEIDFLAEESATEELETEELETEELETEAVPADEELLELEIEDPAEDIGLGEDIGIDEIDLDETLLEEDESDEELGGDADSTVEDFEATLGYSEQVMVPPPEADGLREERAGDSLADREEEPIEEEIDLGITEEEDIIPLAPEEAPATEDISFEDTDEGAVAPIEEIELELEELEEEVEEEPEEEPVSDIPSLDELEEDESIADDGALPDLDIDAELAEIGELSDEPEELPEHFEAEEPRPAPTPPRRPQPAAPTPTALSDDLKTEIRSVLSYMDQLLESLPEEKIEEFARSEHFEVYRKLFEDLGLER